MSYNFMKFMPCNECCECTRFVDEFDCRDNLTDGEWEILSGSWELVEVDPDEHHGFIRWTWGVEHQCETAEGPDELTVTKWVRTKSHRYEATVVERVDAYHIVVEFDTGFGFVVEDQINVRFVELCTYASWYRYIVTAIEGEGTPEDPWRVALHEPTESHAYPDPNDNYTNLSFGGSCGWSRTFSDFLTYEITVTATVLLDESEYKIRVSLSGYIIAFGEQFALDDVWEKSYGETPPDCYSISGEELDWVSSSGDWDGSEATCTITATGDCNRYCEHCNGEDPNAPNNWDVSISGMVPAKSVTIRQRLDKLGTAGAWNDPLLTVNLYEDHGFIVDDRVIIEYEYGGYRYMYGFVTSVAISSIVVQRIGGEIPPQGNDVIVMPYTYSPCVESREPTDDGTTVGEMALVAAWPDNVLEGQGKIRLTRQILEDNFFVDVPAAWGDEENDNDIVYRLYFGCTDDALSRDGFYVSWRVVRQTSFSGTLTTRTDYNTGVITLDETSLIEVGDVVNAIYRFQMKVTAVSGNEISVNGGYGYCFPAEGSNATIIRLGSLAVFKSDDTLIGNKVWKSVADSITVCVWTNPEGEKVVLAGGIERPLGEAPLIGNKIGFGCDQPVRLPYFAIEKRQDECPECNQVCNACLGGIPPYMKVVFPSDTYCLKYASGCTWSKFDGCCQYCIDFYPGECLAVTVESVNNYYHLSLNANGGHKWTSEPLGPSDEETVVPSVDSLIVHGTEKEGTYEKCEFNDGDRWVITGDEKSPGIDDSLEVICIFSLTEERRATELTVDWHFLEGHYHSESVTINDGTHLSGSHSDTHEEDEVYYWMTNEEDNGDEEIDIQFELTAPTSRLLGKVTIVGRYTSTGEGQVHCYAWNYDTSDWDQISSSGFSDAVDNETKEYNLTEKHKDDSGYVLIRLASVGGLDEDRFRVDFLKVVCRLEPTSVEVYAWNYDTEVYDRLRNDCQPTQLSVIEEEADQTFVFGLDMAYTNAADGEVKIRFLAVGGSADGDELHLDYASIAGEFRLDCLTLSETLEHTAEAGYTCQVTAVDEDDCVTRSNKMRVTFEGVVNAGCGDCENWNTSFDLEQCSTDPCCWACGNSQHACAGDEYQVPCSPPIPCDSGTWGWVKLQLDANIKRVYAQHLYNNFPTYAEFTIETPDRVDCKNIGPVPLTYTAPFFICDWRGAKCFVSEVPPE